MVVWAWEVVQVVQVVRGEERTCEALVVAGVMVVGVLGGVWGEGGASGGEGGVLVALVGCLGVGCRVRETWVDGVEDVAGGVML